MSLKEKLGVLGSTVAMGLGLGCSSLPRPVKHVLTPVAVARDVVDIPLVSMANFWNYVGEAGKDNFGKTDSYTYWSNRHGPGIGVTVDVTYPVGKILSGGFGVVDWVACRSFLGESPWRPAEEKWPSYLFPNTKALWEK